MYFLSYLIKSYPVVMIKLFICYLLGPTSSCVILSIWYLIFSGPQIWGKLRYHHNYININYVSLLSLSQHHHSRLNHFRIYFVYNKFEKIIIYKFKI
jgi:hypothetical protein